MRNLISDVRGLKVGNTHDERLMSGVTMIIADAPFVAAADGRGGGLGTRETDALSLQSVVGESHAIVLSGGSAFGLDAATGAQAWLRERGIGFAVREARVPIVPGAILFDLLNGGDKAWGRTPPYAELAYQACERATDAFEIGSVGAGYGAMTVSTRGGLGSASARLDDGTVIGALAAVNPAGSVTIGKRPQFWAGPFETAGEFGGLAPHGALGADDLAPRIKGAAGESTVLAIVATDASLDKPQAKRLAIMAQTGLARAIYPVHTPLDGDIVFALSTRAQPLSDPVAGLARIGAVAANVLARAVARAVYSAGPVPEGWQGPPSWRERFGENAA